MDLLCVCVTREMQKKIHLYVKSCHQFRDPVSGRTHPRLQTLLKMTHLTAERRVRAIFYWAHVLGTKAEVIVESMRIHSLVAVSTLQLLLIATRGHRSYTLDELRIIFHETGREFFKSLEKLAEYVDKVRMKNGREAHERNKNNTRPPVPFKRMKRHDSDSDTASTDDENTFGGLGKFEYSLKVLPHALTHVPEHVRRGGHFAAYCTFLAEVSHKEYIKLSAAFAATKASHNETQENMLDWVLW